MTQRHKEDTKCCNCLNKRDVSESSSLTDSDYTLSIGDISHICDCHVTKDASTTNNKLKNHSDRSKNKRSVKNNGHRTKNNSHKPRSIHKRTTSCRGGRTSYSSLSVDDLNNYTGIRRSRTHHKTSQHKYDKTVNASICDSCRIQTQTNCSNCKRLAIKKERIRRRKSHGDIRRTEVVIIDNSRRHCRSHSGFDDSYSDSIVEKTRYRPHRRRARSTISSRYRYYDKYYDYDPQNRYYDYDPQNRDAKRYYRDYQPLYRTRKESPPYRDGRRNIQMGEYDYMPVENHYRNGSIQNHSRSVNFRPSFIHDADSSSRISPATLSMPPSVPSPPVSLNTKIYNSRSYTPPMNMKKSTLETRGYLSTDFQNGTGRISSSVSPLRNVNYSSKLIPNITPIPNITLIPPKRPVYPPIVASMHKDRVINDNHIPSACNTAIQGDLPKGSRLSRNGVPIRGGSPSPISQRGGSPSPRGSSITGRGGSPSPRGSSITGRGGSPSPRGSSPLPTGTSPNRGSCLDHSTKKRNDREVCIVDRSTNTPNHKDTQTDAALNRQYSQTKASPEHLPRLDMETNTKFDIQTLPRYRPTNERNENTNYHSKIVPLYNNFNQGRDGQSHVSTTATVTVPEPYTVGGPRHTGSDRYQSNTNVPITVSESNYSIQPPATQRVNIPVPVENVRYLDIKFPDIRCEKQTRIQPVLYPRLVELPIPVDAMNQKLYERSKKLDGQILNYVHESILN